MAADMEASMFSMFNMRACIRAYACVFVHACMGHPPHTHLPAPQEGGPPESLKI